MKVKKISDANKSLADQALRVLAAAFVAGIYARDQSPDFLEKDLCLLA